MLSEQQIIEKLKKLKENLMDNNHKHVCIICHNPFVGTKHQRECDVCIFRNDNI